MAWAGALDGIFETFARDFCATPLNMYRNFRSKPKLLRLQNEIIRTLDPSSAMPEEQLKGEGGMVFAKYFDDSLQEAEFLASQIENWIKEEQIPLSEIAVLVSKQLDLYADHLMAALERRNISYRNEHNLQDICTEPVTKLLVDYLSCLYGQRKPKAWTRLTAQLIPFSDEESRFSIFQKFIQEQRSAASLEREATDKPFVGWWNRGCEFLRWVGIETLVALSPDYENHVYLKKILQSTKARIEELLDQENNLPEALERFSDDQAVRILTIHKSKGLEFDSVIIMAIEEEIFFGDPRENFCAFFVGVSRAKRRLLLTAAQRRPKPIGYKKHWAVQRNIKNEYWRYAIPFLN